jgi:hypothetical protein
MLRKYIVLSHCPKPGVCCDVDDLVCRCVLSAVRRVFVEYRLVHTDMATGGRCEQLDIPSMTVCERARAASATLRWNSFKPFVPLQWHTDVSQQPRRRPEGHDVRLPPNIHHLRQVTVDASRVVTV